MFGWLKKSKTAKEPKREWIEYKGYKIAATPISEGSQYRVSGVIEKGEDELKKSHSFVRADLISSELESKDFSIMKAKLMVDQLGDGVFSEQ